MRCIPPGRRVLAVWLPVLLGLLLPAGASGPSGEAAAKTFSRIGAAGDSGSAGRRALPALTDSLYAAHHPRLLYTAAEIPALYAKVRDGGADDTAYSFIRILIQYIYPGSSDIQLLAGNFALTTIPNLGVGSVLQSPADAGAREKGRNLTVYIADNFACGDDAYESALRLRSLALGYDMFFEASTASERAYVRDEILSYVDAMLHDDDYEIWIHRPYLANKSAMIAASLGLAAICLDGEADPAVVEAVLRRADDIIREWTAHHLDEEGAYSEGAAYGSWSMRHLTVYFWARLRYDGYDYALDKKIRNMEKWFAYELLPSGGGAVNNIQDCATYELPVARNTAYFDWAKAMWGSALSAYIWDHVAGAYGYNAGADADKAATVIWHRNIAPVAPSTALPPSMLWEKRGLYYFRTGWPAGANSKDILFSFYSGRFEGGHAQEDQNQFTLYAYGAPFAMDHGPGTTAKESQAHNMILIDGAGQHNAGSSIGTDGEIRAYLLNDFSDYVAGDAASAYATYSPVNNRAFPFPWSDWSWGYGGSNPVERAVRSFIVVRDADTPPYFILIDDIDKDGLEHLYEWRLHTGRNNAIDLSTNPIAITTGAASLEIHVVNPPFASLQSSVSFFNNLMPEADSNVLSLSTTTADPFFVFVLVPGDGVVPAPAVTHTPEACGFTVTVAWPNGKTDVLLVNRSGAQAARAVDLSPAFPDPLSPGVMGTSTGAGTSAVVSTDAALALVRFSDGAVEKYMLADAGSFAVDGTDYVTIHDGKATVGFSGSRIDIDRYDADFSIYAPGVSEMFCRARRIYLVESGGMLTRDPVTGVPDDGAPTPALRLRAYPNPFNPATTVCIDLEEAGPVAAAVFDAKGRRVRALWNGPLPAGRHTLLWNGENDGGAPAASGVYFLTVTNAARSATVKIVLVR